MIPTEDFTDVILAGEDIDDMMTVMTMMTIMTTMTLMTKMTIRTIRTMMIMIRRENSQRSSASDKVPISGLGPDRDQCPNMVPKKSEFASQVPKLFDWSIQGGHGYQ